MKKTKLLFLSFLILNITLNAQVMDTVVLDKSLIFCTTSSTFSIDNFELIPAKPLQVVIGEPIDYKARPRRGNNYQWKIGNLFWPLTPLQSGTQWSHSGKAIIPLNNGGQSTLPTTNVNFGSNHGLVEVEKTRNGMQQMANQTVKVYYDKDGINPNSNMMPQNTSSELIGGQSIDVPNWFYYWSQAPEIQNLISNLPGIKLFNTQTCAFNLTATPITLELIYSGQSLPFSFGGISTYGNNKFSVGNFITYDTYSPGCGGTATPFGNVIAAYTPIGAVSNPLSINIGEGCGFSKNGDFWNTNGPYRGIDCFYKTVAHEVEHALIEIENWSDGYDSLLDMDNDGYNDNWEMILPPGFNCPWVFTMSDYIDAYLYNTTSYNLTANGQISPNESAGTQYEECRCRIKESQVVLNSINQKDWSFDKSNLNQGKQW